jgi:hypothetical protein
MGARQKLNVAYAEGGLIVAVVFGLLAGSWTVFVVALAVLIGGGLGAGTLRLRGRGR